MRVVVESEVDWWYVASGLLKVALYETRAESPTSGELMENGGREVLGQGMRDLR